MVAALPTEGRGGSAHLGAGLPGLSTATGPFRRSSAEIAVGAGGEPAEQPVHAPRHTTATRLLLRARCPQDVHERLGHSSISMTPDIYSRVLPRMGKAAADKLEALLT